MAFSILVVDDSKTVRSVIAKCLRLTEVPISELHQAANGLEALTILKQHWIDLVFADINMPVMTGVELVDRMSEDGLLKTIPVVIVSTEGSKTRVDQLRAKGIRAYIRKPFTPENIRDVVNEVMEAQHER